MPGVSNNNTAAEPFCEAEGEKEEMTSAVGCS